MILDGGPCPLGIEFDRGERDRGEPGLLRPGALPREAIEHVLGAPLAAAQANHRGRLAGPARNSLRAQHDASGLTQPRSAADEALLAFGPNPPQGARVKQSISASSGNLEEAAAKLFAALRELDQAGATAIAVMPIPAYRAWRGHQRPLAARGQSGLALMP